MRDPEALAVRIAQTILPASLDMTEWGIVEGIEIDEDTTKNALVGVAYLNNRFTSPPDGMSKEVGNPVREYVFILPIVVSDIGHANETQKYLGEKLTEIQTILEDECGAPEYGICATYEVRTEANKIVKNVGQVDLFLTIPDF